MLRFGEFTLDADNRVFQRAGQEVSLEPKVFDLLELLVRRPARLVTIAELHAALWPDAYVSAHALRRVVAAARKGLGDSGRRQRWIKTRSGLGYVLDATVERRPAGSEEPRPTAADRPLDTRSAPLDSIVGVRRREARPWPCVGREAELAALSEKVLHAMGGAGGTCLVAGEAGAGKSELLSQLQQRLTGARSGWFVGRSAPGVSVSPFWPWCELAERIRHVLSVHPNLRAHCNESWTDPLRDLRAAPHDDPQSVAARRLMLCDRLISALCRLSALLPLCLVVEDVHWADEGSLLLLELLARRAGGHRICTIATYRSDCVSGGTPLSHLLGRTVGRDGVHSLEVNPLSLEAVRSLLKRLRDPAALGLAPDVLRLTGGNALFVRQVIEHAREVPGRAPDFRVSVSLRHVIRDRTAMLPVACQQRLSSAAVLGERFDLSALAAMHEEDLQQLQKRLRPAIEAGLLAADDSAQRWRFCHGLVRDGLYDMLADHQRQSLHRAACNAFERTSPGPARDRYLAEHAYFSGGQIDTERAQHLCERAGREALRGLGFDQAATHLERAVALSRRRPPAASQVSLLLELAHAFWHADRPSERIAQAYREAADLARRFGDAPALARAAIGLSVGAHAPYGYRHPAGHRPDQEIALLREALGALGHADPKLEYELQWALSWMHLSNGDDARARTAAARAQALEPGGQDPAQRIHALRIRALHALLEERFEACFAASDRASALARESARPAHEQIEMLIEHSAHCAKAGALDRAQHTLERMEALARELPYEPRFGSQADRQTRSLVMAPLLRIVLCTARGQFREAETRNEELIQFVRTRGIPHRPAAMLDYLLLLWQLHTYRGNSALLRQALEQQAQQVQHRESAWYCAGLLSHIALEEGKPEAALAHYQQVRGAGLARTLPDHPSSTPIGLWVRIADLCVRLGSREDAEVLYGTLRPFANVFAFERMSIIAGSTQRALGELAYQLGQVARAEDHLRTAIARNRDHGMRPEQVRSELALADLLATRGAEGEAGRLREAARARAAEMGMAVPPPAG